MATIFNRFTYNMLSIVVGNNLELLDADTLRLSRAKLLCFVSLSLLGVSLFLNWFEGSYGVLPALVLSFLSIGAFTVAMVVWNSGKAALLGTAVTLLLLGLHLVLGRTAPNMGSLFWFLLFPPMLMFCLGLRMGSMLVIFFLVMLALLLFTPLNTLVTIDLPLPLRSRFLAAMVGSFCFAWLSEYMRHKTQVALLQAMQMFERHALTDPLTSLGNRRDFKNHFISHQGAALRSGRGICLAMADLDHFKKVNDAYGHNVGDQVLCHVAGILAAGLRQSDRIFRWGGEEFLILMPDTDCVSGRICAERLRQAVEELPFHLPNGERLLSTISIGLHCGRPEGPLEKHLTEADAKLYLAKKNGRNRVES